MSLPTDEEPEWLAETLFPDVRLDLRVDRVLHREASLHHRLALFRNGTFGTVLMLDGAVQVTTADEFMYHEMMAHVPILAHGAVAEVLIVGGGDCGLAEEVLKHPGIRRLRQVEIDPAVLEFARRHFGAFNAPVFEDPRFQVEIADGAAFAARTDERFDVILVDSTDPVGPGAVLFTEGFYRSLHRCLRPGGVVVTQNGIPFMQAQAFGSALSALSRVFATASCFVTCVPSYFGGHMALGWAHDGPADALHPPLSVLTERAAGLATRYYTAQVHVASFALPRYIADLLASATARHGQVRHPA